MFRRRILLCAAVTVLLAWSGPLPATTSVAARTTWCDVDVECPLCHAKNRFATIVSYGSYIYEWPSKFQMLYWPHIDEHVVYTCRKCRLSMFMWDFEEFPLAKSDQVRAALADTRLSKTYAKYTDIPMSERLAIAARVYSVLDRDQVFWCDFHRVTGYHLACEKMPVEAAQARRMALAAVEKCLADPANAGVAKRLLVVRAAMHHFLGDDGAARADLQQALKATIVAKGNSDEQNKDYSVYLNKLINEYLERLANGTVPKDDGTDEIRGGAVNRGE